MMLLCLDFWLKFINTLTAVTYNAKRRIGDMSYLGSMASNIFSVVFVVFLIAALGYLIGGIRFKGISLGTAGILVVSLLYGILVNYIPSFFIGNAEIILFDAAIKTRYSFISSLGTAMFVAAVGFIAGPKFFRTFNKKTLSYVFLGIIIILIGTLTAILFIVIDDEITTSMAVGLLTGALTSTPGLASAREVAMADTDAITAGYGIAYLFGVLGVVFFVQLVPKILNIDMEKERKSFVEVSAITTKPIDKKTIKLEPFGFFPFMLAIAMGVIIGSIRIPGIGFSLGISGGTLAAGLIIGHFGHIGSIDCRIEKGTLNFFREFGLILFLIGAGVSGGIHFISNLKLKYFLYGAVMTLVPMIAGYLIAKYIFKLTLFNNLGSITGGMTSTPALGALIAVTGTDEVASAYAATYPIALASVVIASKLIIIFC